MMGPFVYVSMLLVAVCSAQEAWADPATPKKTAGTVEGQKTFNLYGSSLDGLDELQMVPLDDLSESLESEQEWNEPNLARSYNGSLYESQYAEINEMLVKQVDVPDVKRNMAKLVEMRTRVKKSALSFLDRHFLKALELLIELNRLTGNRRCNRHSHMVLLENDRATNGRAHRPPTKMITLSRVDRLVQELSLRHAIDCFREYPKSFERMRESSLDQLARQRVESFMDSIIGNPSAVATHIKVVKGTKAGQLAYSNILKQALEDPEIRFLGLVEDDSRAGFQVNEEGVQRLVRRYLVEPCQLYVRTLGPDVFIPAHYDVLMLEKEDRYKPDSYLTANFMHGWIHFRLCQQLVDHDEIPLTRNLIDYIKEISKNTR